MKMSEMIEALVERSFINIHVQMDDNHAYYFDAVDADTSENVEIKIEKEDNALSYRQEGREDWLYLENLVD